MGHGDDWKHEGSVTRSFRFDAEEGRWTQVGPAYACVTDFATTGWHCTPGVDLAGAFAAALPDGDVLVAGGSTFDATTGGSQSSRVARAWDPATGRWFALPSMPEPRDGRSTATLSDG